MVWFSCQQDKIVITLKSEINQIENRQTRVTSTNTAETVGYACAKIILSLGDILTNDLNFFMIQFTNSIWVRLNRGYVK